MPYFIIGVNEDKLHNVDSTSNDKRPGRSIQQFSPPGEAGADLWDPHPDGEGPQGTGRLHTSQWLLPGMQVS